MKNPFKKQVPLPEIHLDIPKEWNDLSVEQLEGVSRILIDNARKYTSSGYFSDAKLLSTILFYLCGIEPVSLVDDSNVTDEDHMGDAFISVDFKDPSIRQQQQIVDGVYHPIMMTIEEIRMLSQEKLGWILNPSTLTNFPYQEIVLKDTKHPRNKDITLYGPAIAMSDFSWHRYRSASDFMSYLAKFENSLIVLQKRLSMVEGDSISAREKRRMIQNQINAHQKQINDIRSRFLATIFLRQVNHIDQDTGKEVVSPFYVTNQCNDNAYLFSDFPEDKFQCVSLWWQGMLQQLARQFPKVFRSEKPGKASKNDDPFTLYTRSTTTMIKYAASSEDEVNKTTYTIILQHMNDMADENDRMKEIQSKHK